MSLISVIVPCYNLGKYLSDAVESLLAQTYSGWECIIVNDGSYDNTESIAGGLCRRDSRIRYVAKPNGGLSSARNAGLAEAKGQYIQLLDADDFLHPEKFSRQLADLEGGNGNRIAICDHYPFFETTKEYAERCYMSPFLDAANFKTEVITELQFRRSVPCHSVLTPKRLIDGHRLRFYENLPNHEDWVFWSKLFYYADGLCYQPEKLAHYRLRPDSMATDRPAMAQGFLDASHVLESFYKEVREPDLVKAVLQMRREISNNLFPYNTQKKIYSTIARGTKRIFGIDG